MARLLQTNKKFPELFQDKGSMVRSLIAMVEEARKKDLSLEEITAICEKAQQVGFVDDKYVIRDTQRLLDLIAVAAGVGPLFTLVGDSSKKVECDYTISCFQRLDGKGHGHHVLGDKDARLLWNPAGGEPNKNKSTIIGSSVPIGSRYNYLCFKVRAVTNDGKEK
jgi:hypothetical protein